MAAMPVLTSAHDAVLALFDLLPEDIDADADLVAGLLGVLQAEAARLLDELETAGDNVDDGRRAVRSSRSSPRSPTASRAPTRSASPRSATLSP
jgi:hypothetical protein